MPQHYTGQAYGSQTFAQQGASQQSMQMSPISIAIDCLNQSKLMSMFDTIDAMECATPQLRQAFKHMAEEHLQMADDWFRLVQNRGWYQVAPARMELINQLQQQQQSALSFTSLQGQIGLGQTSMGQAGMAQTGFAQAGAGQTSMGQAGIGQTGAATSGFGQSGSSVNYGQTQY